MSAVPSASLSEKSLTGWIKNHPLTSFIILAFVLAIFWLPGNTVDLGFINGFAILGSLGPALAGVLVSGITNPNPSGIPAGRRWRLCGLLTIIILAVFAGVRLWMAAGLVSIGGLAQDPRVYPNLLAVVMDVIAAAAAGFVLSNVFSPRQGVRDLLASLDIRQKPVKWYGWLFALAVYPAVLLVGNLISAGLSGQPFALNMSGPWYAVILTTIVLLAYFIIGGGGMEEPGWRGFALPRLLARYKPLGASLILGLVWSLWHWPVLMLQIAAGGYAAVLIFVVQVLMYSVLFTAVYARSRGSLPLVMLLHAAVNLSEFYLPPSTIALGLWLLLTAALAVWMGLKPGMFKLEEQQ